MNDALPPYSVAQTAWLAEGRRRLYKMEVEKEVLGALYALGTLFTNDQCTQDDCAKARMLINKVQDLMDTWAVKFDAMEAGK